LESPDLPVCIVDVEAENRISLRDFSRVMLRRVDGQPYAHSMLIEGNDDRGINVGLITKTGFDIDTVRTHIFIFDLGQNDLPIFSRDLREYLVRTPGRRGGAGAGQPLQKQARWRRCPPPAPGHLSQRDRQCTPA
jgi:hypothetical protein